MSFPSARRRPARRIATLAAVTPTPPRPPNAGSADPAAARAALRAPEWTDLVAPDWAVALAPVAPQLAALSDWLGAETAAGRGYLPAPERVLRAFARPLAEVRVLVVGQDPYPTPGHSTGLAFSTAPHVRPVPRSLANIFTELTADVGVPAPSSGDLTAWADRGVMLLNRVLTVRSGESGAHRRRGWEQITDAAIAALVASGGPLVAILWGRDAQSLAGALGTTPTVNSAHPSPLSARRGFVGSRPFSRVNALLVAQGAQPVDWSLP